MLKLLCFSSAETIVESELTKSYHMSIIMRPRCIQDWACANSSDDIRRTGQATEQIDSYVLFEYAPQHPYGMLWGNTSDSSLVKISRQIKYRALRPHVVHHMTILFISEVESVRDRRGSNTTWFSHGIPCLPCLYSAPTPFDVSCSLSKSKVSVLSSWSCRFLSLENFSELILWSVSRVVIWECTRLIAYREPKSGGEARPTILVELPRSYLISVGGVL